MIAAIISKIAELQPKYSSSNTDEMAERGVLIRQELPNALRAHTSVFASALGPHGVSIGFEGSDGIGRKTQAPWVRIFSSELSPSATTGFYMVIHFSVDGLWCFVTDGCGATRWDNDKGDLIKSSDKDLRAKVDWVLSVLKNEGVDYSNFSDEINIGSKDALPKSFEKATVLCRKFSVSGVTDDSLVSSITEALEHLAKIYDAYGQLSDLPQSQVANIEVESVINPRRKNAGSRQGYGLCSQERKAVELRAMDVARVFLENEGFKLKDVSTNQSYDYLATKNSVEIKVEVKGTTSNFADSVLMTANEVDLHSSDNEYTALGIVSGIRFVERGESAKCVGGTMEFFNPWDISQWEIVPTAFVVKRP